MAQPTVARRIEALEHALGLVLFERNTRGFQPTADANALISEAEAIENAAGLLTQKARRLMASRTRTIRITAFKDAFVHRLPAILAEFMSSHDGVQFELLPSDDLFDIADGAADVAIRVSQSISDQSLICRKLRENRVSLFASRAYAAKHGLPRSEAEFEGHAFILYDGRMATRQSAIWLRGRIDPGQVVMTCDSSDSMAAAVLMGTGIGLWTQRMARGNDSLVECFELPPETSITSWLLVNAEAYRRPEVRDFAAFLVPRWRASFQNE